MSDAAPPHDLSAWLSSREPGPSAHRPGRDLVRQIHAIDTQRTGSEPALARMASRAPVSTSVRALRVEVEHGLALSPGWRSTTISIIPARNTHELAEARTAATARPDVSGRAEMLDLGARRGATAAVWGLIDGLVS